MNEIDRWFDSGAEVSEGLRLLSVYAPGSRWLPKLVTVAPERFVPLLKDRLSLLSENHKDPVGPASAAPVAVGKSFRESWPFLSEPDCPIELKVLAADKITAWRNYTSAHNSLFDCATTESCFEVAKKVIINYMENRKIYSEFAYYNEHHSVLGKHPIFAQAKRLSELRKMSVISLLKKQRNLEGAIWRINNEIGKKDKPWLLAERETRRTMKESELKIVNNMIKEYDQGI